MIQAIQHLTAELISTAFALPGPNNSHALDVCIYDANGMCLRVWNNGPLALSACDTLDKLILQLQDLVSLSLVESEDTEREERLVVSEIEVRKLLRPGAPILPRFKGITVWIGPERRKSRLCLSSYKLTMNRCLVGS